MAGNGNGKSTDPVVHLQGISRLNALQVQVEKLNRWQQDKLREAIDQYDAILCRNGLSASESLKIVEAKAKALSILGDNSSRISLALERERRELEQAIRKERSLDHEKRRLMFEVSQAASKAPNASQIRDYRPPKVRMFAIGCDFKATVGLGTVVQEPPKNWNTEDVADFRPE